VSLRLALSDGVVNLAEECVDVALRIGALPDSSLKAARLGTVRVVTVASPGYLKRRGRPRAPAELERHACVQRGTQAWTYQSGPRRLAVTVKPRLEVGTSEAALDAAVAGLGITQLFSYQVAGAVSAKRLEVLLANFEPPPLPVNLVYLGDGGVLPVKLRAFLDFGVSRLKARVEGASLPPV
jgi:DNA-binding transcriptional LysR family regulator